MDSDKPEKTKPGRPKHDKNKGLKSVVDKIEKSAPTEDVQVKPNRPGRNRNPDKLANAVNNKQAEEESS